jgi:hypothetical protein
MKRYRCYFLTADGRVGSYREIETRNDHSAIALAHAYFRQERIWQGFEVWRGRHRVYATLQAVVAR